jgi:Ca-activated chloride channel family protein
LNWQFQYPEAFWLLALIPAFLLLFFFYRLWREKAIKKIGDPVLVKTLFSTYSSTKSIIKFILIMLAFACGCIALANPRKPDQSSAEARKGIDIVMALDVSNSMLAPDVAPNRLTKAKLFISKLMDNLQDDRIGLVVFAGTAYDQMPLTFDQDAARMYVSTADPKLIAAQGTSIGDALAKSDLLFAGQSDRFRSIILITDGETHDDNALQAAQELSKKGIMINTVGIGSPDGSTIIDSSGNQKKDAAGQVVISKLNEQILQQMAAATNGKYIHLENPDAAVKEVLDQFSQIDKKALGDVALYSYSTFYSWLAVPMLLLLFAEIFLPDRKNVKP